MKNLYKRTFKLARTHKPIILESSPRYITNARTYLLILPLFLPTLVSCNTQDKNRSVFALYNKTSFSITNTDSKETIPDTKTLYSGSIKLPDLLAKKPLFRLYYCGAIIPVDADGSFVLQNESRNQIFSIIITARLETPEKNITKELKVAAETPYLCFNLLRIIAPENKLHEQWHIEKQTGTGPHSISDNTLVVLFDAALIEDIHPTSWKKESYAVILPEITCKSTVTPEQFEHAYNRALMAALDSDSIHAKSNCTFEQHTKNTIKKITT